MEKRKLRFRRPVFVAAAAAAAALTVSVGAGALVNYFHQRSVDIFFPDASETASAEVIDEASLLSSANEHYRITLDKTYFDGENLTCIMTVESLDGSPLWINDIQACHDGLFRGGSYPLVYDMSSEFRGIVHSSTEKPFVAHVSDHFLREIGIAGGYDGLTGETYIRFGVHDGTDLFDGIELCVNVEKNIDTAELFNADGDRLIMTQIGFYSNEISVLPKISESRSGTTYVPPEINLIRTDGTVKGLDDGQYPYAHWSDTWCYVLLSEFMQLDDYAGIEINGVRYLKR